MRQSTMADLVFMWTRVSELPVRQSTSPVKISTLRLVSELPVRQSTYQFTRLQTMICF